MLKKVIKYVDYNGREREEEHLFNLSTVELAEMEGQVEGGMEGYIKRITEAEDLPKLIALFQELILKSYGVKSEDGRSFLKTDEIKANFKQTAAYNALFNELAFNTDAAIGFVNGIIPKELSKAQN